MELLRLQMDIIQLHRKPIQVSRENELLIHRNNSLQLFHFSSAAPQPTYDYGYGRPQAYDAPKTYYQQPGASYQVTAQGYADPNSAAKATYAQPPQRAPMQQQKVTQYSSSYANPATAVAAKPPTANAPQYSNYDTALYSAASVYMQAQQAKGNPVPTKTTNWQQKKGTPFKRQKPTNTNKVQQVHYCDVCRISCAGPQTYREHLEGQKHKKREALQKAQQEGQPAAAVVARGSNLRCELCDVTCTGSDAYAAHVRGSKHQKVVKLHTKLGKPIPSAEPSPIVPPKDGKPAEDLIESPPSEDIKPVGEEYIEELKDAEGKVTTFNCKLCDCKFNDPNAKEMHTKGRRHRLQYKKKVQPDLVVDVKPTLRQRKMAEREKQRQQMQDDVWSRRGDMEDEERIYWEQRRMEEECGGNEMAWGRGFPGMRRPMGFPPSFNNVRRIESLDDRHVITRHAEIYPKEDELQSIQRIVSHTERALKLVSDAMTEVKVAVTPEVKTEEKMETQQQPGNSSTAAVETETKENDAKNNENKENGTQNQMISFQKDTEGTVRVLKGVMRVGLLAKGLLLQGDNMVQLVVLCAEKPTSAVLKRVVNELPQQLKKVSEEHKYTVTMAPVEGAVLVSDGTITVKVSLTSPLLREPAGKFLVCFFL